MRKPVTIILSILLVIAIAVGVWWFLTSQNEEPVTSTTTETSQPDTTNTPPSTDDAAQGEGITIVFSDAGFDQQSYTVPAGQSVTLINESSIDVEFSSDDHPTHTQNTELNMAPLQPNQQLSFTPKVAGEWGIHDHIHPGFTTTLTVTE